MAFVITCESSADLNADMYEKYKIPVMPFTITMADKQYKDFDITNEELFKLVEENGTLPKTSAFNEYDYEEFFKEHNKGDGIIHFCISSKVSSTINSARAAAEKMENVHVIDSLSLSTGTGLQVLYAIQLRDKGVPIEEAVELINARRSAVQISFVVDTLKYLHKGGRCSALALLGSTLLGIKPSIVLKDGKMLVGKKYKGKIHRVLDKYIEDTLAEFNNPDPELCFITYSSATDEMKEVTKEALAKYKFKNVIETTAGCTVATHCGPNTLGIIYYNDGGKVKK
ncbi:MAG: DegV family protein [Clostridiales bacterium]|nr:DegV family protein [Clostridiales bacterium]